MCIIGAKEVFFEVRFIDESLVESWEEHHCPTFWQKNLLDFTISRKFASKSTAYNLSRCAFLRLKRFSAKYDFLMKLLSNLDLSTIVHLFDRKICLIWPFFGKLRQKVPSIACFDLHFWGQKSVFRSMLYWWSFVRFFIRAALLTFLMEKTAWILFS